MQNWKLFCPEAIEGSREGLKAWLSIHYCIVLGAVDLGLRSVLCWSCATVILRSPINRASSTIKAGHLRIWYWTYSFFKVIFHSIPQVPSSWNNQSSVTFPWPNRSTKVAKVSHRQQKESICDFNRLLSWAVECYLRIWKIWSCREIQTSCLEASSDHPHQGKHSRSAPSRRKTESWIKGSTASSQF